MNTEQKVETFFKARFPHKDIEFEKEVGYFYEWVHRFNSSDPTVYMDDKSLEVYNSLNLS